METTEDRPEKAPHTATGLPRTVVIETLVSAVTSILTGGLSAY